MKNFLISLSMKQLLVMFIIAKMLNMFGLAMGFSHHDNVRLLGITCFVFTGSLLIICAFAAGLRPWEKIPLSEEQISP